MKVLVLVGSMRTGSLNRQLAAIAAGMAERAGATVVRADPRAIALPLYDGDVEAAGGLPPAALALAAQIEACDGLLIASPEYNYSVPGVLKNAIDWVSRAKPSPLRGKRALLLSASPSLVGGNRGLWALRMPLEALGVHVFPDMFSLASAHAVLADGALADAALATRLEELIGRWIGEGRRLTTSA
ncbi:MAG: NAD(P)H-dependent oxidoreductase [Deltaproteobacteria bacterium]|nr:NAD(P)H-dependent oxidoreductase [Deltaproteobacteria bacterium]